MAERVPDTYHTDIVPRPARDLVPSPLARQLGRLFSHRRYAPANPPHPGWLSFGDRRHVRDIALDAVRNQVWLATWGGVVCWSLGTGDCTYHASEHGLPGNSVRRILLDRDNVVWAAGEKRGLCSLSPGGEGAWRVHEALSSWTVLQMTRRPGGGVYAALRRAGGPDAMGIVPSSPDARPALLPDSIATKSVAAALVDDEGALWTGNLWGLYRHSNNTLDFQLELVSVKALTRKVGGGLWVGTNTGVYQFRPKQQPQLYQASGWPPDPVVCMAEDPQSGDLWVLTTRQVGRISDQVWQPVRETPHGRLNVLRIAESDPGAQAPPGVRLLRRDHAWVGGAEGLFNVGVDEYESALPANPEDSLGNAVGALHAGDVTVCVGMARGLFRVNEQGRTESIGGGQVRDVRSIVAAHDKERVWVGAWRTGLYRLEGGRCLPEALPPPPVVSLASGGEGSLWAATADAIYRRENSDSPWQALPPAPQHSGRVIQAICYQSGTGAAALPALWVGTSRGLSYYRPEPFNFWVFVEPLRNLSIQCLTLDPLSNRLWVGTSEGLFNETEWKLHLKEDVRALTFTPAPEGGMWLGMASCLEWWHEPGRGEAFVSPRITRMTCTDSGLAADEVTALAARNHGDDCEVWVGSPSGLSCYRHPRDSRVEEERPATRLGSVRTGIKRVLGR